MDADRGIDGAAGPVQASVHFEHGNDEKESGTVPSAGARLADFYTWLIDSWPGGCETGKPSLAATRRPLTFFRCSVFAD
jgi:hypothetical protein